MISLEIEFDKDDLISSIKIYWRIKNIDDRKNVYSDLGRSYEGLNYSYISKDGDVVKDTGEREMGVIEGCGWFSGKERMYE